MRKTASKRRTFKVRRASYDVALMKSDMDGLGLLPMDIARRGGMSHPTVSRFFSGVSRTPRTAKKIADALEQPLRRYIKSSGRAARPVTPEPVERVS